MTKTIHIKENAILLYSLTLCLIIIDGLLVKTSLFDPLQYMTDGAYRQYIYIKHLLDNQILWSEASQNYTLLMHTVRYAIYETFISVDLKFVNLQYSLLVLISFPVLSYYSKNTSHIIFLTPLILAFFLSYRSILGIIAVGYLVIFLFSNRKFFFFFMGAILSFLSSALLIQFITLITAFGILRERKLFYRLDVIFFYLIVFFLIIPVLYSKILGFHYGLDGYHSSLITTESNFLLTLVSRSTIIVGLASHSIRGYIYIAFGIVIILLILKYLFSKQAKFRDHRLILLCLFPGFFGEGLGVMSIALIFLWAIFKVDLSTHTKFVRFVSY